MNFKRTFWVGAYQKETHKIEIDFSIENERLSISAGVWEKSKNGRWREDSFGQCYDYIEHLKPKDPLIKEIVTVWKRWHLNDMRPNCEHQKGPEWTSKDVTIYHFTRKTGIYLALRDAENRACEAIKLGKTFTPTKEETKLANLAHSFTQSKPELSPDLAKYYEPNGPKYENDSYNKKSEIKSTGWLTEKEHPEGFLSKPCPVCGYKYGTKWITEKLPLEVIETVKSWQVK